MSKMLNKRTIKDLFELNKPFLYLDTVDGKECIVWKHYNIATPTSTLFNKLDEINKKRVLFYGPLVIKYTLSDLLLSDIKKVLSFHEEYDYDYKSISVILNTLINRRTIPVTNLRDMIYDNNSHESILVNHSAVAGGYFFLNCLTFLIYNELDRIPYSYSPLLGLFHSDDDKEKYNNDDINDFIDTLFKNSLLPEVI